MVTYASSGDGEEGRDCAVMSVAMVWERDVMQEDGFGFDAARVVFGLVCTAF